MHKFPYAHFAQQLPPSQRDRFARAAGLAGFFHTGPLARLLAYR